MASSGTKYPAGMNHAGNGSSRQARVSYAFFEMRRASIKSGNWVTNNLNTLATLNEKLTEILQIIS